ncbi:cytochrome P450 [Lentinula aff. lateritia]|uniref:Cytochrome P450 n=1 Tax=Lentinula aff. lateritia TaxID=2804960 RepID=A0ACC1TIA4_9AGAR|nr:cytochrome P450 [Lentinula aff. lateritia]
MISFHVLGRRIVVLNSAATATDLLTKRSTIYSDRPYPMMAGVLMKREKSMFYISYNDRFRTYRTLFHRSFNAQAAQSYWPLLEREAKLVAFKILQKPVDLFAHLRGTAAVVTMKIAYGYQVTGNDDYFVTKAEESMRVASLAGAPGKWLVDSLPFLRFIPEWAPGASFKSKAKRWHTQMYTQYLEPVNYVKEQLKLGNAVPSFTSQLLQPENGTLADQELEDIIVWTAGAIYAAATDTTVSAMKTFFAAMMLYPDIQKQAQREVDSFISLEGHLPGVCDRHRLPFIEAVYKEVLRWHPPAPMALFHCTSRDDEYKGYHIPAKTTVIANVWAMMHDENVYPHPMQFDPFRFFKSEGEEPQKNPLDLVFGFGRRVCAGQEIGEATVILQMMMALALLDISQPIDETTGKNIEQDIEFTTAIVSHPKPFQYKISQRSSQSLSLMQDVLSTISNDS